MPSISRKQAGDTIVEVLIVLAVLSSAFAIAYGTATKALNASRQAQEHAEALQFISSQIEFLRVSEAASGIFTAQSYCMKGVDSRSIIPNPNDFGTYPTDCTRGVDVDNSGSGLYKISITYQPDLGVQERSVFLLQVTWDGLGGQLNQERIIYKKY